MASLSGKIVRRDRKWLVTGAAGFIGSHLVEALLREGQTVVAVDNLITGKLSNLEEVLKSVEPLCSGQFQFIQGDLRDVALCEEAVKGVDVILHQASLGSVPRSIKDPLATHSHNVNGFVNLLNAARIHKISRLVYASSSSVYGSDRTLPKIESLRGEALSPYALTKQIVEDYAKIFHRTYGMEMIGLRYFNVFGPRQDFSSPYAAVIPRWMVELHAGRRGMIFGDGKISRDFCFVANVVEANLLAGTTTNSKAFGEIFNIALGEKTTLLDLYGMLFQLVNERKPVNRDRDPNPIFSEPRLGEILHSQANIEKAKTILGYSAKYRICDGLPLTVNWFIDSRSGYSAEPLAKTSLQAPERAI